jgi:hypothetical protein
VFGVCGASHKYVSFHQKSPLFSFYHTIYIASASWAPYFAHKVLNLELVDDFFAYRSKNGELCVLFIL